MRHDVAWRLVPEPRRDLLSGVGDPDDTGAADPALAAALAAYAEDPDGEHPDGEHSDGESGEARVLAALAGARLLVPVVAVLGEAEVDEHGLVRDKSSDMATVLMQGVDGRLALLAFTGLDSMRRWDPEARPVAVPAEVAARAALQDGAAALLLDVAGPVAYAAEIGSSTEQSVTINR